DPGTTTTAARQAAPETERRRTAEWPCSFSKTLTRRTHSSSASSGPPRWDPGLSAAFGFRLWTFELSSPRAAAPDPFCIPPPGVPSLWRPEQLGDFRCALGVQLDDVAGAHALEQPLHVPIAQADAAVRVRRPDRPRLVGSVNAVALFVQPNPAGAERVCRAGTDDSSRLVVSRVRDAVDDGECADGSRRVGRTDGNREHAHDRVILNHGQLAIGNADDEPPHGLRP